MEEAFKTYLFTYRHDGSEWVLPIKARDAHDARERLKGIALARFDGEAMARIDVPTVPMPLSRLFGKLLMRLLGIRVWSQRDLQKT